VNDYLLMNHRTTIALISFSALLTGNMALCQSSFDAYDTSVANTIEYFKNTIGTNSFLYTGKEYTGYNLAIKGTPYFETDTLQKGDIFYDGHLYKNIPMLYDIVRQVIVIDRYHTNPRISLLSEKIKYFTFDGHKFENARAENGNAFFDVLSDGTVAVWARRIKIIRRAVHAEDPDTFTRVDELYVKIGNALFPVTNKSSALQAFDDKRSRVKTFIRKKRLKFKKHLEEDLVQTASFYSSLP
jgi:hypothetical protein